MAIEFSDRDRVSLFIAVCDVDRVQSDIINQYTEQLKPDFQSYQIFEQLELRSPTSLEKSGI
jgi:hypothetical protein